MSKSASQDDLNAKLQELSILMENRTFVDYFNIFLCLPVFGQHVLYNFKEAEFDFEPPMRKRRHLYIDRREILIWLYHNRFKPFRRSPLYTEYILCTKISCTDVDLPGIKKLDENGVDKNTFIRNVLGTATGMMLFRESMRGTCGESVYRCWKDIEAWRHIEDPVRKMYWKHAIKTKYISQNSPTEVKGNIKMMVYQGILNFDMVPDSAVQQKVMEALLVDNTVQTVDSDEAMLQLQRVLLNALRYYWVPRHLLHIINTANKESLDILKRPAPVDHDCLSQESRQRCRFLFPTIYQESNISSPETAVFVSNNAGELPRCPRSSASVSGSTPSEEFITSEEESAIEPRDLLSLWGGPYRDIAINEDSSTNLMFLPEYESPDEIVKMTLRPANASVSKHVRSPIPIALTSYLGGKKRALIGQLPKTSNRIIWSLASDILACCPFRSFLESNEQTTDIHYLSFWTDVRNYLDADENSVDNFGQPLRALLANRLADKYLSLTGVGSDIFAENVKMSIFNAIINNNDESLLCIAQDIVQQRLWEPLTLYIKNERRAFLKQVRGRRCDLDLKRRRQVDMTAKQSRSATKDGLFFFQYSALELEGDSATSTSTPGFSSPSTRFSATSCPVTSFHICIKEEQTWKAMELAVLCCEYGSTMMLPQYSFKPEQLVEVLRSDYGSLHVSRIPTVRNDWLGRIFHPPKINIETLKVSRKVILETIDISAIQSKEEREIQEHTAKHKYRRRGGVTIERPRRPQSFEEVLMSEVQFDFFKRFLTLQKSLFPLLFWKAVEDAKYLEKNPKAIKIKARQIMRAFFKKRTNPSALLDCEDDVIREISRVENVPFALLVCAQSAVSRSMERNWFSAYLDMFPPESVPSSPQVPKSVRAMSVIQEQPEIFEEMKPRKRRLGYRKKSYLWSTVNKQLVEFCRALNSKAMMSLLEVFIKYDSEKEQQKMTSKSMPIEKNILVSSMAANMQTRVLIRNRLVVISKIPMDLRFFVEVKKYQDLVDSARMTKDRTVHGVKILFDKAMAIIDCFLESDIPPKVQVNITNEMATNILADLISFGPVRGLFYDAVMLIFPVISHFFNMFKDRWLNGAIPTDFTDTVAKTLKITVATTPHPDDPIPEFNNLKDKDFRTTSEFMFDESCMKISFSIRDGIFFVYPKIQPVVKGMTKHGIKPLPDGNALRRESLMKQGDTQDLIHSDHSVKRSKSDKNKTKTEMNASLERARDIEEFLKKERKKKTKKSKLTMQELVSAAMNALHDA